MEILCYLVAVFVFGIMLMWFGGTFLESLMTASMFFIISLGLMNFYESVKESSDNKKESQSQAHETIQSDSPTPAVQTESRGQVRKTAVLESGFANQEKP